MREVKFRGKCVETSKWIYGYFYRGTLALTDKPICLADCRNYVVIMKDGDLFHVKPDTLGEFTGMYDKNNNDIYTGDLLKDSNGHIWEVVFENGKFICENIYFPGKRYKLPEDRIVGNIHDGIDLDECNCSERDCESCKLYFAANV